MSTTVSKLLYISVSPRGELSASRQAARVFLDALPEGVGVEHIDLFERELPAVTLEITAGKQKAFMGMEFTAEEARQWAAIVDLVDEFKAADHYLMAVPMWNYNVPYKFKQYIDLLTHPGLTFTRDENGPRGLVAGGATLIYSRGGDYSAKDGRPDPFDFQSPYLQAWCKLIGLGPVDEVFVQRTMFGPDGVANSVAGATVELQALAAQLATGYPPRRAR